MHKGAEKALISPHAEVACSPNYCLPDIDSENGIRRRDLTDPRCQELRVNGTMAVSPFNVRVEISARPPVIVSRLIQMRLIRPGDAVAALDMEGMTAPVHDRSELEPVIAQVARTPDSGLIVIPDGFLNVHRAEIIALVERHRVPTIYPWRFFPQSGGLLSYGSDQRDQFRLAATYVDRILKGEKPSQLPVQAPVKFELVINLRTAKALGLEVPLHLQQSADEVIE